MWDVSCHPSREDRNALRSKKGFYALLCIPDPKRRFLTTTFLHKNQKVSVREIQSKVLYAQNGRYVKTPVDPGIFQVEKK